MTTKSKYQSAALLMAGALLGLFYTFRPSQAETPPASLPNPGGTRSGQHSAGIPASSVSTPPAAVLATRKVGIVDMNRIFTEYHKTAEVEKKLNEDKSKAKKEMDGRVAKYKELAARLAKIEKILSDRLVNEQLKQQSRAEGQTLMNEANAEARGIEEFRTRRERQLKDQSDRLRKALIQEIVDRLREKAKRDNYDFVFDKSGLGLSGTLMMPVSRDAFDFSSEVIADLNRNAPPKETGRDVAPGN